MGKNGDSGSTSGPQIVPIRSTTGWMPLPCRLCVVSGSTAFLKATIRCGSGAVGSASSSRQAGLGATGVHAEAAGDGEPAHAPGAGGVQRVEQAGRVRAEEATGSSPGMEPARWTMSLISWRSAEGEEGVPVGDVERFHGDPADEERGDLGPAVRGDDDLVSRGRRARGRCGRRSCPAHR